MAVLITELSGRMVFGNRAAATLFGHAYPLSMLGSDWARIHSGIEAFHENGEPYRPEDWPLARVLKGEATVADDEIWLVRPDGTRSALMASASAVNDAAGNVVVAVATFNDISHRAELAAQVRESEQRFQLVAGAVRIYAIVMLDPAGNIVMWNPGAALLFGYTEEEALGSSHRILYSVADTSTGMPERFLREALERDAAIEEERLMCRKDGRTFWASGTLAPLKSASGAHRGFLLLLQDATAARALEERMRQARMDAESARDNAEAARDTAEAARDNAQAARDTMLAASRAKDDFFAVVTHELRTPLTAILLWTRVLRDSRLDDEAAKEAIATIERSARAQQRLIDDLLDLTRVSSGNLRLSMRETHLGAVIQAAAAAIEPAARARGVTLTSDVSASIGMVHADPDRLQQVIWNLLSNSVKFTPTGGSVTLSAWREAGEVVVKVTDTGVGIARDFLPLLFHRFRQAHVGTTPRHAGLGLGLAIARQLTELHGGTLTGESLGAGQGATFLVRLPLEPLQQK